MQAGIALFGAQPVDAVSVDDITAAADIAKGSFYNHFKDKDDLARAVTRAVRDEVEARVAQANTGIVDPALRMARALCVFAQFALEEPERAKALQRLHAGATLPDTPANRGLRADLETGLRTGRFAHCGVQTAMLAIMGTVQIAMVRALDSDAPRLTRTAVQEIAAFQLRGLGLTPAAATKAAAEACQIFQPGRSA